MTDPRFRFIHKGEKGFTLIEIMVVIVLIGLMTSGITAAIMQVLTINTRTSNHMIAVRQVQQAGKEVSKDALQSQPDKIAINPTGAFLALNWTSWEGQENEVVYTIEDGELQRSHKIDGYTVSTAPPVVAEYIDDTIDPVTGDPKTSCVWDGEWLIFTVTATVGTESETRIYEIEPRPES